MDNKSVLYVIIVIMAIAIIGMSWFIMQSKNKNKELDSTDKELPQIIDLKVKEELIRRFAKHWHEGDERSINLMFDFEAGKDLIDFLERWKSSVGDIVNGAYSHHDFIERVDDQDFFKLYYLVRFEKEEEGWIVFDIYCNDESYKPVGFNVGVSPKD